MTSNGISPALAAAPAPGRVSPGATPVSDAAPPSDALLAQAAAAGDRAAAAALIERHHEPVRLFLRRLIDATAADDLAQETFVRMLRHVHRYDPQYPMRTWLFTIARRLSINWLRRRDRHVQTTDYHDQRAWQPGPADVLLQREQARLDRQQLTAALAQLSEPQRAALVLFHQQELDLQQIAAVMAAPVGTVKSHLHRGRAALRKLLGPQRDEVTS